MYKKYAALILAVAVAFCSFMTGCGEKESTNNVSSKKSADNSSQTENTSSTPVKQYTLEELGIGPDYYDDKQHEVGYQLESPDPGEEIAVMHTNMGDITMRFFPEAAPNTVENFVTHAKNGYYDGLTFHRVINDFMIQGGDPKGDGTGGESVSGEAFADEFSNKLFNIRGSVAMANSGEDTNGSQFFINQAKTVDFEQCEESWKAIYEALCESKENGQLDYFLDYYGHMAYNQFYDTDLINDAIKKLYEQEGGNPTLDGAFNAIDRGHTVFAQVIDGMDVVDKIAAVDTDPATNKPTKDVIIESIDIITYE